jgi:hypothetical protein
MKMSDILHDLADMLDQKEQGVEHSGAPENTEKSADDFIHPVHDGAASGDNGEEVSDVMIPPLQAKLELLKKATGVDNAYDDQDNELNDIKKMAGITIHQIDDADLDGQ